MTASRPSADLTVPAAARDALWDASGDLDFYGRDDNEVVRAIACPVVAQFLRDLASAHDRVTGGFLAELADELDPDGGDA